MQRGQPASGESFNRIQPDGVFRRGPGHMQVQRAGLVKGQPVQELGISAGIPAPIST